MYVPLHHGLHDPLGFRILTERVAAALPAPPTLHV
jgi:hypothetical protein